MLLKRLELQGFKTFASRSEFVYGSGITAIVGPNGSGKSNVADAIRWVLGEQSGRLLRTKKTEDVVFAGSSLRAPAGMAEVNLTFDNSGGWLPLDFSEVTIGRRVYRAGDSEYYINRGKVRLKDVVELLLKGGVGQNDYTVVGQGLVDTALSLRPEERRGLIEEAANTRRYYIKIAEARTKLEATLQNLSRARDIVSEIGPRLTRLQKQASQAAEYGRLTRELSVLLTAWYYQSWQKSMESLIAARASAASGERELAGRREELESLAARIDETREARSSCRSEVVTWQKDQSLIAGKLERVSRQLAIDRERLSSLSQQRRELAEEIDSLDASALAEERSLAEARERLARLGLDTENEQGQLALVQAELDLQNASQAGLQTQLSRLQEQLLAASAALSDAQNRLAQLDERDAKLANEVQRLRAEEDRLDVVAGTRQGDLGQLQAQLESCKQEISASGKNREDCILSIRAARERIRGLELDVNEAQRERTRLQSQFDTLSKLQDSHSSLYAGVRTVLQAAKASSNLAGRKADRPSSWQDASRIPPELQLSGVVGIIASLVEVPQHLEVAIEVALGGHLQDIVVEKWADAERAIDLLKASKGGRATFLPLDTMKGGRAGAMPKVPGVLGIAADLVSYDSRLRNIVAQLLGQTIVVEELGVARKLVGREERLTPSGWSGQIVTMAGEIVRPNGSLTGGATKHQAEGTLLARQRELRELPEEIRRVSMRQGELEKNLELERLTERRLGAELVEVEKRERQLGVMRQSIDGELAKLQRELDRVRQEAGWQKELGRQADDERGQIEARRSELTAKLAEAELTSRETRARLTGLQREAEDLLKARAGVQERFNELRTRLAVMGRAMESEKSLMANHEQLLRRVEAQREAKRERLAAIAVDGGQLESEVGFLDTENADLSRQAEAIAACIEPAIARLSEMDAEESLLLGEETAQKARVLEAERKCVQVSLAVQRCEEDLSNLRERMEGEGIEPPVGDCALATHPDLAAQPWQLSLGLRGGGAATSGGQAPGALQVLVEASDGNGGRPEGDEASGGIAAQVAADPAALKRRIDRLRAHLRGIGPVNTSAIDEYEETRERFEFLEGQIRDLAEAEKSLQEGIALLDSQARKQFDSAFEDIGREFRRYFSQLFGGGTAKLVKNDETEDGAPGIEIIAQPPGKRLQNLSLLSGGERALTSIALLFAILEVNPIPFCVLDEVDAALDESNVGRFATALQQLAKRTQFIVITHNRGTVELADTIYGISLGADGMSRTVSLRVEEALKKPDEGLGGSADPALPAMAD